MYQIYVNGLLMGSKPTSNGALAMVSVRWHSVKNVEIKRNGAIVWKA